MVTLAAAAALTFAAPSFAEDQSSASSDASADNPIICKVQPSATGSRLGERRVCMHKNEWTAQEQSDRSTVDQAQTSSLRAKLPGN